MMIDHPVTTEKRILLQKYENLHDFDACRLEIGEILETVQITDDEDQRYELGAAYVQFAVYQLICGLTDEHEQTMQKAAEFMPDFDRLALRAITLSRIKVMPQEVSIFCDRFFELFDKPSKHSDPICRYYYDTMIKLSLDK